LAKLNEIQRSASPKLNSSLMMLLVAEFGSSPLRAQAYYLWYARVYVVGMLAKSWTRCRVGHVRIEDGQL
jgi:hypothetical protein